MEGAEAGSRGKVLSRLLACVEIGDGEDAFFRGAVVEDVRPSTLNGWEGLFVRETRGPLGGGLEEQRKEQITALVRLAHLTIARIQQTQIECLHHVLIFDPSSSISQSARARFQNFCVPSFPFSTILP